jgi:hypothetical protein
MRMTTTDRSHETAYAVMALCQRIYDIIEGQDPALVTVVLAQLLAHLISRQRRETPEETNRLRSDLLYHVVFSAKELIRLDDSLQAAKDAASRAEAPLS